VAPAGPFSVRTEERLARAMAWVRVGTAALVFVPLADFTRRGGHFVLATACAAGASAEAAWVFTRVRRKGTVRDVALLVVDVVTCIGVLAITSRAVPPGQRNNGVLQVVSFALAGAGFAGFGFGFSLAGAIVTALMAGTWALASLPDVSIKLVSDTVGFFLWYAIAVLAGGELRSIAAEADETRDRQAELQAEAAERRRAADVAREREITHREVHDHLLPIVDAVASGRAVTPGLARVAAKEAERARRLLTDPRLPHHPGFGQMVEDVAATYADAGLAISAVYRVVSEPPAEVAEAVSAATREALCNALKYSGALDDVVNLYVESTEAGLEVVVRDRGTGFDPASVTPGGGFLGTYEALRRLGGEVEVVARPSAGTKVTLRWSSTAARAAPSPTPIATAEEHLQ
jgi:signal transduction histidine kinase